MSAIGWFIVMAVVSVILLFIASIGASIASSNIFRSSTYAVNSKARSAQSYLTGAWLAGWFSLAVLIIILIVAAWSGVLTNLTIPASWSTTGIVTQADLSKAIVERSQLSSAHTAQILVLIFLIIIAIITFIVGILAAIAAGDIASIPVQDGKSRTAYTWSLVAAIAGIGGIVAMVITVLFFAALRSQRDIMATQLAGEIAAAKTYQRAPVVSQPVIIN